MVWRLQNTRWMVAMGAISLWGAIGCNTSTSEQDASCEDGEPVTIEGVGYCVYERQSPIVIETGFMCPRHYTHRVDTISYVACADRQVPDTPGFRLDLEVLLRRYFWDKNLHPQSDAPRIINGDTGTPTPRGTFTRSSYPMDMLFVIDNSFSMCQEQKVLRRGFGQLVREFDLTGVDFHIGVTTTHAPADESLSTEPIARAGMLQSTPQPVPGVEPTCVRGDGVIGGQATEFAPLRESLAIALGCLASPATASEFMWTDAQIACALESSTQQQAGGCVAATNTPDRDGNARVDIFDLFPSPGEYRAIPKVLRAINYRTDTGVIDTQRLQSDFACISHVGTRGSGFEKGLRAATLAVSPALTGGPIGPQALDESAPNHGLLRQDAALSVVFVTDENDCSHDGTLPEIGNACGANLCDYYNSASLTNSPLVSPERLAEQLREHVALSKLTTVAELDPRSVFVASIHGSVDRYEGAFPQDCAADRPAVDATCSTALGDVYSGDRYDRFIRQFEHFYPSAGLDQDDDGQVDARERLDFDQAAQGWMCSGDFASAMGEIGQQVASLGAPFQGCVELLACQQDAGCPIAVGTGQRGSCDRVQPDDVLGTCSSSVFVELVRTESAQVEFPSDQHPYCLDTSAGAIRCVVDPALYSFEPCERHGSRFTWSTEALPEQQLSRALAGYTLQLVANRHDASL